MRQYIISLLTSRNPMIQCRGSFCVIFFTESDISMKVVRLVKICLNESYLKLRICRHLSDIFFSARRCFIVIAFNFALENAIRKVQTKRRVEVDWDTSVSGLC